MIDIDDLSWGARLATGYVVTANIPYAPGNAFARLDVYQPCGKGTPFKSCEKSPKPTLMFVHGGGWSDGATKETYALWFLPFLQLGWIVVNVEYRPSGAAPAPAALEDCLGALRWIGDNASRYGIDTAQLVIGGLSAGGQLALMVAALAPDSGPRPCAAISWCGIVDLIELTTGPARQDFAVDWVGKGAEGLALARELSPISYVREGGVPVITAHGDQDLIVPYGQAVRFHEALTRAGVRNDLVRLQGAGHAFDAGANLHAYPRILDFLSRSGVTVRPE